MNKLSILVLLSVLLAGCSKMEEKKSTDETKAPVEKSPMTKKTESNAPADTKSSDDVDEKAVELSKLADDAIEKYTANKSEDTKAEVLKTSMAAGNYLTFEATLPAREKYRPALKYYRMVLVVDPDNAEALKNKKQIEDIYLQMGMPIPE